MISEIALGDPLIAAAIHTLAQRAYTLEAEQIGCADFPPLRESLQQFSRSTDRFLVLRRSETILGALSFSCEAEGVVITRLVVDPAHVRQGIAYRLLVELEGLVLPGRSFLVSTAKANIPAVTFYQKLGYVISGISKSISFSFRKLETVDPSRKRAAILHNQRCSILARLGLFFNGLTSARFNLSGRKNS